MAIEHLNALPSGYQLEEYQLERVLGAGGFGITYLAHEKTLKRKVAIKEFLPRDIAVRGDSGVTVHPVSSAELDDYEYGLERFRDEARTLVSFRHPNIVSVHRLMEANNTAYLVMEYEEGDSLDDILKRDGTLVEAEVREILFPLLDGLDRVHKAGFLHRDIKPANIYIRHDGSPVLIDFGAARQALGDRSRSLTAIVSTGYAPMEQYSVHGNQGAYTDLYALAATAYKSLTGKRPPDAVQRIAKDPFEPVVGAARGKADATFLEAIDWALATDPEDRPQTVGHWLAALHGEKPATMSAATFVAGDRQQTHEPQEPDEAPTEVPEAVAGRRSIAPWLIAGGIALAISATLAGAWVLYTDRETEKREEISRLAAERNAAAERKAEEEARRKAAEEEQRKAEARRRAEEQRKKEATRRQAEEDARRKEAEKNKKRRPPSSVVARLRIAIINKCYKNLNVVYRHKQSNGTWITLGWQQVRAGQTRSWNFRSTSRTFYMFAESFDRKMIWSGKNKSGSISAPVVYRKFSHTKGPLYGPGRKNVSFVRRTIRPQFSAFTQTYTCR